jgi:hypothetical protein
MINQFLAERKTKGRARLNALETLESDVLSSSKLDEVLLAVDDGEGAVL